MRKFLLNTIIQIIYRFAEKTPPEVKYSKRNHAVAEAALAVGELVKII